MRKPMRTVQQLLATVMFAVALSVVSLQANAAMEPGDIVILGTQGSGNSLAFAGDGTDLNQLGSDSVNWGSGQARVAFDPSTGDIIFGVNGGKLWRYGFDPLSLNFSPIGSSTTVYSSAANGIQDVTVMADGTVIVLGVSPSTSKTFAFAGQASDLNQQGSAFVDWGIGKTSVAYDQKNDELIFASNSGRLYRYGYDKIGDSFPVVGSGSTTVYSGITNGIQDVTVMADGTIIVLGVSGTTGKTYAFAAQESDLNQQGSAFIDWGIGMTSVAYDAVNDELVFGANSGRLFRYSYDKIGDSFTPIGSSSFDVYSATNGIQGVAIAPASPAIPEPATGMITMASLTGLLIKRRKRAA